MKPILEKKTQRKGERWLDATDVARPRSMTTECTKTWLLQPHQRRLDTQQWSSKPSIAHAILNSCGYRIRFSQKKVIFWRKFKWKFLLYSFLFVQCTLPPKKVQKILSTHIFSKGFLKGFFLIGQTEKWNHQKNRTEKRRKEKTQQAQTKIKKGNWKIEKTSFKQKNQEEIKRSVSFFQKTNFRKRLLRKLIVNERRRYDKDKLFLEKLERRIFFWTRRDYHKMRSGQKCFCSKSNFCGKTRFFNFFSKKKKQKGFSKNFKKIKNPITENQKRNSRRDLLDKWFLLPKKKKGKLDLVRKNTIEKNNQKKGRNKKTIEPTKFYK